MSGESDIGKASDPFSEEEDRLAQIEAAIIEADWEDPLVARQPAEAARDAYKWLLKRYRRTLRLADRMESRLKSSLDKEAEQRAALEDANRRIRSAQDELVQAEKLAALGGMVAGIAHEINTPLGIIRTASSTLAEETTRMEALAKEGKARKSDVFRYFEIAREAIDLMEANSDRSANLIRSFKDVAVDRSSDSRRRYPLAIYVDEVLSTLRPELKKTRLRTVVDIDPMVEVDGFPGAMAQIITNLVMNSIKHGYAPDAEGTLAFRGALDAAGWVQLTYSDTGGGVPDELRKTMFDPFVTTKRGKGGSGLGLHILHNIVVGKFGGRVSYRDTEGGGATFDLRFPATAPGSERGDNDGR